MMNCQACRNEIEELEPGASLSVAASAHVGACLLCDAFYHERFSLRKLVGSLEPVSVPPDFEFRLRARLAASGDNGNRRHSFWRSFVASTPAIAFAAVFALLVAGVVLYNQFKPAPVARNQSGGDVQQNSVQKSGGPNVNPPDTATASNGLPKVSEQENQKSQPSVVAPMTPTVANNSHLHPIVNRDNPVRRQSRQVDSGSETIVTNETAVRGAPRIIPGNDSQSTAESNHVVELPVRSSAKPVKVFVDNKSGGQHAVTLEPVIFGSQDLTGRNDARMTSSQGIW